MNNKCVIITGPNSHLGIHIVNSLLKNYSVIGISRKASKARVNPKLISKYRPCYYQHCNEYCGEFTMCTSL